MFQSFAYCHKVTVNQWSKVLSEDQSAVSVQKLSFIVETPALREIHGLMMESSIFWNITPRTVTEVYRCFGGTN
jgi:hypothetical protein